MVSFAVQKLLNLIKSHLFIFVFIFITWFVFKYLIGMVPSHYFPGFSFPLFFLYKLRTNWPIKKSYFYLNESTLNLCTNTGLPSGEEPACQYKRRRRCRFNPWIGKIPWRRKWQPNPVFLPRKFHWQRSLAGYSPQGCKELDTTEHITYHLTLKEESKAPQIF